MTTGRTGVWGSRSMLRYLVRRDLALKYQRSVMGYLWSLIEPIGIGVIYYFVFIVIMGRGGLDDVLPPDQYILYLMAGIFSYMWTSGVIGQATGALTGQKNLITTMNVPREVFPIAKVIARCTELLVGLPILAAIALIVEVPITWRLLLVIPLAVLVQACFLTGVALLLSSANVMMQDIERFMSMIGRLVFYSSPILYPLAFVEERLPIWGVWIYKANPLVGIVELYHSAWFPSLFPSPQLLVVCVVGSLTTLGAGWIVFRRLEPVVLKEL